MWAAVSVLALLALLSGRRRPTLSHGEHRGYHRRRRPSSVVVADNSNVVDSGLIID